MRGCRGGGGTVKGYTVSLPRGYVLGPAQGFSMVKNVIKNVGM